jgi:hypothetical protein
MARFKGGTEEARDVFVPVAVVAVLIVLLILLVWYLVDRTAFMVYWNSLGAAIRR